MTYQSDEDAEANELSKYWGAALSDTLYQDITLDGNAQFIGDGEGRLFDAILDYEPLNQEAYWAFVAELPVNQQNPQVMS